MQFPLRDILKAAFALDCPVSGKKRTSLSVLQGYPAVCSFERRKRLRLLFQGGSGSYLTYRLTASQADPKTSDERLFFACRRLLVLVLFQSPADIRLYSGAACAAPGGASRSGRKVSADAMAATGMFG